MEIRAFSFNIHEREDEHPNLLISEYPREGIVIHRRHDPFGKIVSPLFLDFPLNLNNLIGCEYIASILQIREILGQARGCAN